MFYRSQARSTYFWPSVALACALAFSTFASAADPLTQAGAQDLAKRTNRQGSDDDQDLAYRNAMKAFMNLAALNIPGAISKGYEAYGNYINSEKFDDLEARTKALKGDMTSAGLGPAFKNAMSMMAASKGADGPDSGVSGKMKDKNVPITTMSRLDPGFMYRGETAAVAEEFEKRSGMKREEFFKHLSSATDAQYRWDDPNLQEKLEQRFQAFKANVRNPEFKAGLERAEAMVPNAIRQKMMGEAMAFYQNAWKGGGPQVASAAATPESTVSAATPSTEPASTTAAAGAANHSGSSVAGEANASAGAESKEAARAPAAATAPEYSDEKLGFYIGLKADNGALNQFFQSAGAPSPDDTIFTAVSRKYRKLTPGLVARRNSGDAR